MELKKVKVKTKPKNHEDNLYIPPKDSSSDAGQDGNEQQEEQNAGVMSELSPNIQEYVNKQVSQNTNEQEETGNSKTSEDLADELSAPYSIKELDEMVKAMKNMEYGSQDESGNSEEESNQEKAPPITHEEMSKKPHEKFEVGEKAICLKTLGIYELKTGEIVEVSEVDSKGNITELAGKRQGLWAYRNRAFKKLNKQTEQDKDGEQEQPEPSPDAQNGSNQGSDGESGTKCTPEERAFLDAFLKIQEAGYLLGMVNSGEHINGTIIGNLSIIPVVNKIQESQKMALVEYKESAEVREIMEEAEKDLFGALRKMLEKQVYS